MTKLLLFIGGINILGFALMGWDKYSAIKNKWRISEDNLLGIALLGGAFGTYLGMIVFHHKTKKKHFQILVPIFMIINIGIYYLVYK